MSGDERGVAFEVEACFAFEHAQRGKRDRHQSRLRVLGQRQPVGGTVPHDRGELLAQRFIDLGEDIAGGGKIVRQGLAHADGLAALAGKNECNGHL